MLYYDSCDSEWLLLRAATTTEFIFSGTVGELSSLSYVGVVGGTVGCGIRNCQPFISGPLPGAYIKWRRMLQNVLREGWWGRCVSTVRPNVVLQLILAVLSSCGLHCMRLLAVPHGDLVMCARSRRCYSPIIWEMNLVIVVLHHDDETSSRRTIPHT